MAERLNHRLAFFRCKSIRFENAANLVPHPAKHLYLLLVTSHGVRRVDVVVKGPGSGRETAIRSIQNTGIEVSGIKDVTPVPHNGCRQPKRRRV